MAKLYRVVLIDPDMRAIKVVRAGGTPSELKELVGATNLDHMKFADHGTTWDYAWVDGEGMLRQKPIAAFKVLGWRDPIAGKCALIGADMETGETVDAAFDYIQLRGYIFWLGMIQPEVTWDKTPTGIQAIVTYSRIRENYV
jgi:hypothetical protein